MKTIKLYFNTNTFDELIQKANLDVTKTPKAADILVLGAKNVKYPDFINLKAIYRFGVGSENVDFEYLESRKIPVYFPSDQTKHILYDATANFTVYGILRLLYEGMLGDVDTWSKKDRDYIGNKIALVIGTGNIGRLVVNKLKAFMKVTTYDTINNTSLELEPLIRGADIITIHIPLTDATATFFDEEKLSWVKNDALLINTARGALFNEEALFLKLKNSNCRAFFDVFWEEPYKGKLMKLGREKFFITPHSASNTKEFINAGFNEILNILKGMTNE
jgi:D-3-phosphoglycerate dehydrogenase